MSREEWAQPRGRKLRRRCCASDDRGEADLRPDTSIDEAASVRSRDQSDQGERGHQCHLKDWRRFTRWISPRFQTVPKYAPHRRLDRRQAIRFSCNRLMDSALGPMPGVGADPGHDAVRGSQRSATQFDDEKGECDDQARLRRRSACRPIPARRRARIGRAQPPQCATMLSRRLRLRR